MYESPCKFHFLQVIFSEKKIGGIIFVSPVVCKYNVSVCHRVEKHGGTRDHGFPTILVLNEEWMESLNEGQAKYNDR
jgi:hypothetical protein